MRSTSCGQRATECKTGQKKKKKVKLKTWYKAFYHKHLFCHLIINFILRNLILFFNVLQILDFQAKLLINCRFAVQTSGWADVIGSINLFHRRDECHKKYKIKNPFNLCIYIYIYIYL